LSQPGTRTGLTPPCPYCGAERSIRRRGERPETFTCDDCDTNFGPGDVRRAIGPWRRLLDGLLTAPQRLPAKCPYCASEGSVHKNGDSFKPFICDECEKDFGVADCLRVIGGWRPILDSLETAPDYPGE
jgi:ribosomal protein L37AE/L43A